MAKKAEACFWDHEWSIKEGKCVEKPPLMWPPGSDYIDERCLEGKFYRPKYSYRMNAKKEGKYHECR
jgi:hypothetical protein